MPCVPCVSAMLRPQDMTFPTKPRAERVKEDHRNTPWEEWLPNGRRAKMARHGGTWQAPFGSTVGLSGRR